MGPDPAVNLSQSKKFRFHFSRSSMAFFPEAGSWRGSREGLEIEEGRGGELFVESRGNLHKLIQTQETSIGMTASPTDSVHPQSSTHLSKHILNTTTILAKGQSEDYI